MTGDIIATFDVTKGTQEVEDVLERTQVPIDILDHGEEGSQQNLEHSDWLQYLASRKSRTE